jgi:hypothetical protein
MLIFVQPVTGFQVDSVHSILDLRAICAPLRMVYFEGYHFEGRSQVVCGSSLVVNCGARGIENEETAAKKSDFLPVFANKDRIIMLLIR